MNSQDKETRLFILSQINRLAQLTNPPHGSEVIADYVSAIARADTERIARETVDEFVFGAHNCPKPTELLDIIHRKNDIHREEVSPGGPKVGCSLCKYTGWIIGYWLVTTGRFKTTRERIPQITNLSSELQYKATSPPRHNRKATSAKRF